MNDKAPDVRAREPSPNDKTGEGITFLDMLAVGSWTVFDHLFTVEELPEPGDTVTLTSPISEVEQVFWGGCSLNASVAARKLGFRTGVLMVCGEDFVSKGYWDYLEELGVDTSGISVVPGGNSGHSFIFSDTRGQSICLSHIGVSQTYRLEDMPNSLVERAKSVLVNYRFDRFGLEIANRSRELNRLVGVNGALVTSPSVAPALLSKADFLFINKSEMSRVCELLEISNASSLFDRGIKAIFVTEGSQGCQILTPDSTMRVPAVPPKSIEDTTGAGDAFAGTALCAISRGFPLELAARLAAVVSSYVVEARGCQTSLPSFAQVHSRYGSYFGEQLPGI